MLSLRSQLYVCVTPHGPEAALIESSIERVKAYCLSATGSVNRHHQEAGAAPARWPGGADIRQRY